MIGICTRYWRHEATYLGVQIADWAVRHDTPVSIAAATQEPVRIGSAWDDRVEREFLFTEWLKTKKVVVWTAVPHLAQLQWSLEQGARTVIVPLWHEIGDDCREQLCQADAVIATTDSFHHYLTKAVGLRNVKLVPWHTGQVQCTKPKRHPAAGVCIGVPLFDGSARKVEATLLNLLRRTLDYCPFVNFHVWFNPRVAAGRTRRELQKLADDFGDRCRLFRSPEYVDRPVELAACDVVVVPTHAENTALTALTSILAGTPVVAFNVPPISDVVTPVSGTLVPTGVGYSELHIPVAAPDYRFLEDALWGLLERPCVLDRLQQTVQGVFQPRAQSFDRCLLEGVFG